MGDMDDPIRSWPWLRPCSRFRAVTVFQAALRQEAAESSGVNEDFEAFANGFRDLEFFKLKILALHQAKYALVG